jgi:hypothetical protein
MMIRIRVPSPMYMVTSDVSGYLFRVPFSGLTQTGLA